MFSFNLHKLTSNSHGIWLCTPWHLQIFCLDRQWHILHFLSNSQSLFQVSYYDENNQLIGRTEKAPFETTNAKSSPDQLMIGIAIVAVLVCMAIVIAIVVIFLRTWVYNSCKLYALVVTYEKLLSIYRDFVLLICGKSLKFLLTSLSCIVVWVAPSVCQKFWIKTFKMMIFFALITMYW